MLAAGDDVGSRDSAISLSVSWACSGDDSVLGAGAGDSDKS